MRLLFAVLAAAAALPAVAQVPPPLPPARAIARPVPDETKSCLMERRVQDQRIVDDHTILFREGSRWYRNDLPFACSGLEPDKALRTRTPSASLCSGDHITVFERVSNFTYGSCPLGNFTRIPNPGAPPRRR